MLAALERKLTAIVADAVADRAHVTVVQAGGAPTSPEAGKGTMRVRLSALAAQGGFAREALAVERAAAGEQARRVLPLGFTAQLDYALRAQTDGDADVHAARDLLLEDVSRVTFALATAPVRSGSGFDGDDSGFAVRELALRGGDLTAPEASGVVSAALTLEGRAAVWPPDVPMAGDAIRGVDAVQVPLPLSFSVSDRVVLAGSGTTVHIRGAQGRRLVGPQAAGFEPLALAVTVLSDLPPAERGQVTSGTAGSRTGVRIVLAGSQTEVAYAAPAGGLGGIAREYLAVHLATPERDAGVFLGSTPIDLADAP